MSMMDKVGDPNFKGLNCIGYQNLPVSNAAVGLTVPANALSALVVLIADPADTASIVAYFREDGTDPTATEGMPMTNLTRYGVLKGNLGAFKIISADAFNHSLRIQFYG